MGTKRPFQCDAGGENGDSGQKSKRTKNSIRDVLGLLSMQDMAAKMEPFLRLAVRDEVERTVLRFLQPSSRWSCNRTETSGGKGFFLRFVNRPPSTIFTGSRIQAEDGSPIGIELVDANSKTLISSGPLSSMKIEILVVDGDFCSNEREDWSENEFSGNIIREREGRRPLVTGGDLNVTLRNGFVVISDVVFTDNSSWQRSRKFRLGAKPVMKTSSEVRIREASSDAFIVKDHRGELYKKHYPPQLDDEVWRLEKIAKEGTYHKKLADLRINTVRDFLQFHSIDSVRLRKVLGAGISNKIWDTIIDHASKCVLDDKFYSYCTGQGVLLLFSSVYKVIGVAFDGQNYEALDQLAPHHKAVVETLKRQAYTNVNKFTPVDARTIPGLPRPLTCPQTESFHGQNLSLQQIEFPVAQQDPQEMLLNFNNLGSGNQFKVSLSQNHSMQVFPEMLQNNFRFRDIISLPCAGDSSWPTNASLWPEEMSRTQTSTWGRGNAFYYSSGNEGEVGIISSHPSFGVHMSRIKKPKAGWCKLRAAINLGSVRHSAAMRRNWEGFIL